MKIAPPSEEELRARGIGVEPKRARKIDGSFKADDPATPEINEAWEPPKKRTTRKKKDAK